MAKTLLGMGREYQERAERILAEKKNLRPDQ